MNLSQRASSLIFPAFRFRLDEPRDAEKLVDLSVGGFCLYGGTAEEIFELTQRLQKRARNPLLFCADYEDGAGLQLPEATRFPSNMAVAAAGSEALAREKGRITAVESRALGVDWILAPVVDLATRPENPIVNLRAFGADPAAVIRFAGAYIAGLRDGGALPCIKHFPGHGETSVDSHLELPELDVPLQTLMKRELMPFIALKESAGSVMVAHLLVKALDPKYPATLSKLVCNDFLKETIGFKGLVSTDALSMHAVADSYSPEQLATLALKAGADVLLVPANGFEFQSALLREVNSRPELEPIVVAVSERLLAAKKALGLFQTRGKLDPEGLKLVGCAEHAQAAERLAQAALTWVRPMQQALKKEESIAYFEPENAPDSWEGAEFFEALKKNGLDLAPYQGGKVETLIVGVFSRPQAYAGKIGLAPEEAEAIRKASASAKRVLAVSFGTPFVASDLSAAEALLCTFSGIEASQRAAAAVLAGKAKATGSLPVAL